MGTLADLHGIFGGNRLVKIRAAFRDLVQRCLQDWRRISNGLPQLSQDNRVECAFLLAGFRLCDLLIVG